MSKRNRERKKHSIAKVKAKVNFVDDPRPKADLGHIIEDGTYRVFDEGRRVCFFCMEQKPGCRPVAIRFPDDSIFSEWNKKAYVICAECMQKGDAFLSEGVKEYYVVEGIRTKTLRADNPLVKHYLPKIKATLERGLHAKLLD